MRYVLLGRNLTLYTQKKKLLHIVRSVFNLTWRTERYLGRVNEEKIPAGVVHFRNSSVIFNDNYNISQLSASDCNVRP